MGERPADIRSQLRLVQGGKTDEPPLPWPTYDFNMQSFYEPDTIDFSNFQIPPEYFGKTIDGVQYDDPTKYLELLYLDDNDGPVFDF